MRWDGMGWDGIGWDGILWNGMGMRGMGCIGWVGMNMLDGMRRIERGGGRNFQIFEDDPVNK